MRQNLNGTSKKVSFKVVIALLFLCFDFVLVYFFILVSRVEEVSRRIRKSKYYSARLFLTNETPH